MMQNLLASAWYLMSPALLVELALLGVIGIILLLNESWSAAAFSTGLFWGGALLGAIGSCRGHGGFAHLGGP